MARVTMPNRQALLESLRLQTTVGVARDMLYRGNRVKRAAKKLLYSGRPRRVDTGRLAASIEARPIVWRKSVGCKVGSGVFYARWVHDGTGIYGPKHMPIRPKRAKFLRFVPKGGTEPIFRRSVKGMRPNRYLKNAIPAARY